jgi:hypothetical protein
VSTRGSDTQQELTDDEPLACFEPPPDDDDRVDEAPDRKSCLQSERPALTEAALKGRHRAYSAQLKDLKKREENVSDDGLAASIDGSTDEDTMAEVRAMSGRVDQAPRRGPRATLRSRCV